MNDGEMALVVERLERSHGRMQTEEAVQIDHLILLDSDRRAHGVIVLLAIGDNDVEAVGGATLEEYDQLLMIGGGSRHLSHDAASEKGRYR